ncbi:hypothetical protein FA13DRAFT_1719860 [Coprinellus micaceus]|uniref:Uncharacterized protein n=1 Tax=Coprinellus micaceus TaxID=71717 RepID=A0A4Y7SAK2_COPMI|nr:hypothetical protein FA13DRAFT_1719860 [Coprinellus micaceus]
MGYHAKQSQGKAETSNRRYWGAGIGRSGVRLEGDFLCVKYAVVPLARVTIDVIRYGKVLHPGVLQQPKWPGSGVCQRRVGAATAAVPALNADLEVYRDVSEYFKDKYPCRATLASGSYFISRSDGNRVIILSDDFNLQGEPGCLWPGVGNFNLYIVDDVDVGIVNKAVCRSQALASYTPPTSATESTS